MGAMILFVFYGSILFFILATALRVRKCIRAPIHLHWELYKGSSIYELTEWWAKTHGTFLEKLWSMVMDLLFLREFYHRNRRFWYPLYAFHAGLYLLILWHAWLFIRAGVGGIETISIFGWVWGTSSTLLTFLGGLSIIILRMTDEELKAYYPPIHYLKWIFLLLTLLGGIIAVDIHFHSSMTALLKYVREQVTFQNFEHKLHPALAPALHVLFASVWLVYLPFSHVFQLFFRYYHYLRWDDVPNARGSEIGRRIKDYLERPATWSAPHIQSGKRWREIASELQQTPATAPKSSARSSPHE
jgi:nitrate reductase gamma subunit